jgi:hypothetical protein
MNKKKKKKEFVRLVPGPQKPKIHKELNKKGKSKAI